MFMENTTKLIFSQHNIFININISLCSLFSDFFSINANEVNKIKNVNNRSRLYTSLLYTHCRPFVMLFNVFSEIKKKSEFYSLIFRLCYSCDYVQIYHNHLHSLKSIKSCNISSLFLCESNLVLFYFSVTFYHNIFEWTVFCSYSYFLESMLDML